METTTLTGVAVDLPGYTVTDMEIVTVLLCMHFSTNDPDFKEDFNMSG